MKNYLFLISSALLSCILFVSCSDDTGGGNIINPQEPVDTSSFILTLELGSTWNYESISEVSNIRPDSIRHYFTSYPITGHGILSSVKDTVLNGVTTRQLVDFHTEDTLTYISKIYYVLTDSALLQFAYSLSSSSDIFPDSRNGIHYIFNGRSFRTIRELFISFDVSPDMAATDTLIIENPQPAALRYPIVTNYEWVYRLFNSSVLTKKYVKFENLTVAGMVISCIKTQFKWSTLANMESYQHYSKYGKLRSELVFKDALVSNEFGMTIGKIDIRDFTHVTNFNITE
jgi:hypothetical protein